MFQTLVSKLQNQSIIKINAFLEITISDFVKRRRKKRVTTMMMKALIVKENDYIKIVLIL